MTLTNRERTLLLSLKGKYGRECCPSLDFVDKVILAIEIIERSHRNIVWRFFEYVYLCLSFVSYRLNNNHFDNISIGKYQLKISLILNYINIEYTLDRKSLKILDYKWSNLISIFKNRNNKKVLYNIIKKDEFSFFYDRNVDSEKLKFFIQHYSGNLPFDEDFNYFFVLKELIGLG
jgi:hypothetical protein